MTTSPMYNTVEQKESVCELCWKNILVKQFYEYVFLLVAVLLFTAMAQYDDELVSCIKQMELNSGQLCKVCKKNEKTKKQKKIQPICSSVANSRVHTWETKTKRPVTGQELQNTGD